MILSMLRGVFNGSRSTESFIRSLQRLFVEPRTPYILRSLHLGCNSHVLMIETVHLNGRRKRRRTGYASTMQIRASQLELVRILEDW